MLAGWAIFGFEVSGSLLAYLGFSVLGAACFTSISLLCAARTQNVAFMAGLVNLISIPSILLSGVFFSVSHYPEAMQAVLQFLPLNALLSGLRGIALESQPLNNLGFQALVLAVYGIIAVLAAKKLFKWY